MFFFINWFIVYDYGDMLDFDIILFLFWVDIYLNIWFMVSRFLRD